MPYWVVVEPGRRSPCEVRVRHFDQAEAERHAWSVAAKAGRPVLLEHRIADTRRGVRLISA